MTKNHSQESAAPVGDQATAPVDEQMVAEPASIIELHSGAKVVKNSLGSETFYEFQSLQAKTGGSQAIQWLVMKMFVLLDDNEGRVPLSVDTLHDDLDFQDAVQMSTIINKTVTPYLGEQPVADGDVTLPCGVTVRRKTMKGRAFFQFQDKVAKEGSPSAMHWVTFQAFEVVNGGQTEPLTPAMLAKMSFEDAAVLGAILTQLFTPYLGHRTS